jgi:hypothetical protein
VVTTQHPYNPKANAKKTRNLQTASSTRTPGKTRPSWTPDRALRKEPNTQPAPKSSTKYVRRQGIHNRNTRHPRCKNKANVAVRNKQPTPTTNRKSTLTNTRPPTPRNDPYGVNTPPPRRHGPTPRPGTTAPTPRVKRAVPTVARPSLERRPVRARPSLDRRSKDAPFALDRRSTAARIATGLRRLAVRPLPDRCACVWLDGPPPPPPFVRYVGNARRGPPPPAAACAQERPSADGTPSRALRVGSLRDGAPRALSVALRRPLRLPTTRATPSHPQTRAHSQRRVPGGGPRRAFPTRARRRRRRPIQPHAGTRQRPHTARLVVRLPFVFHTPLASPIIAVAWFSRYWHGSCCGCYCVHFPDTCVSGMSLFRSPSGFALSRKSLSLLGLAFPCRWRGSC